jgi:hypothetical protein
MENEHDLNGIRVIELINEGLTDKNKTVLEYDFGILDESTFFKVEQAHYLLLNKLKLKQFYFHWREKYFSFVNNPDWTKNQSDSLDQLTKCVLLVNPNFASAWSKRKHLLLQQSENMNKESPEFVTAFNHELEFNRLILLKHFKCEQAFMHRRWILRHAHQTTDYERIAQLLQKEIDFIINDLAVKIKSNYYCWSYLNWLLERFQPTKIESNLSDVYLSCLTVKLEKLILLNPSDFSILHTRLNTVKIAINSEINLPASFLLDEIRLNEELIVRYPHYSTAWNYSKYFLMILESSGESSGSLRTQIQNLVNSNGMRLLNESLAGNLKSVYFKAAVELIDSRVKIISDETPLGSTSVDLVGFLKRRNVFLAKLVRDLCESCGHESLTAVNQCSQSFDQFLDKFVFVL